jgi:acetyltransferase-like isoleucine patch superfamily enzyme
VVVKKLSVTDEEYKQIDKVNAENQMTLQQLNNRVNDSDQARSLLSKIIGQPVDQSVEVRLPFYTDYGRRIIFGKNVFVNSGVMFTDLGGIVIEDDVLIGPGASLISVNHPQNPNNRHGLELSPVYIHQNAWIGAKSVILPGVSVGKNAIVAAGAVVTHNVPDNTIVAGVPAKVIKTIVA